jgi:hypothetical protein
MYFSALELNIKDTAGGGLAKQSLLVLEHLPVRRSVVFETKCGKKQEASKYSGQALTSNWMPDS